MIFCFEEVVLSEIQCLKWKPKWIVPNLLYMPLKKNKIIPCSLRYACFVIFVSTEKNRCFVRSGLTFLALYFPQAWRRSVCIVRHWMYGKSMTATSFTKLMYNRCAKYLYCTMLVGAIQDPFLHINHRLSGRLVMSWFFRIWRFSPDECPKLLFAKGRGIEQVFGLPCPARKYEKLWTEV